MAVVYVSGQLSINTQSMFTADSSMPSTPRASPLQRHLTAGDHCAVQILCLSREQFHRSTKDCFGNVATDNVCYICVARSKIYSHGTILPPGPGRAAHTELLHETAAWNESATCTVDRILCREALRAGTGAMGSSDTYGDQHNHTYAMTYPMYGS